MDNAYARVLLFVFSWSMQSPKLQRLKLFPHQYVFAIKVGNMAEALEGAGKTEENFSKITKVGDNSICDLVAVVSRTCIPKS